MSGDLNGNERSPPEALPTVEEAIPNLAALPVVLEAVWSTAEIPGDPMSVGAGSLGEAASAQTLRQSPGSSRSGFPCRTCGLKISRAA